MSDQAYPLQSLREGHWFKLICGASFHHLPDIRNLTLAYTLAGADCIDVAADPAVIFAAKQAIADAVHLMQSNPTYRPAFVNADRVKTPFLMVSLNDGEDPHFRKAEFTAKHCPPDCPRPCEQICPADAIDLSGVILDRCYGCGRCLPVCPIQHISTRSYVSTPQGIAPLALNTGVDAIEIHTQIGRFEDFQRLWTELKPWSHGLKLIAISCPDGEGLIDYLSALNQLISPLPSALIWQTDGRPMSGDIGIGATRAAIKLGQKVLSAGLPGYVQLAGGTNQHTVPKLRSLNLLAPNPFSPAAQPPTDLFSLPKTMTQSSSPVRYIAGVAYGSYARSLLSPILQQLETPLPQTTSSISQSTLTKRSQLPSVNPSCEEIDADFIATHHFLNPMHLENKPCLMHQAINLAQTLVAQLKSPNRFHAGC